MKKLILILSLPIIYSCQSHKIKIYKEDDAIKSDTLNIETIKIKTH